MSPNLALADDSSWVSAGEAFLARNYKSAAVPFAVYPFRRHVRPVVSVLFPLIYMVKGCLHVKGRFFFRSLVSLRGVSIFVFKSPPKWVWETEVETEDGRNTSRCLEELQGVFIWKSDLSMGEVKLEVQLWTEKELRSLEESGAVFRCLPLWGTGWKINPVWRSVLAGAKAVEQHEL